MLRRTDSVSGAVDAVVWTQPLPLSLQTLSILNGSSYSGPPGGSKAQRSLAVDLFTVDPFLLKEEHSDTCCHQDPLFPETLKHQLT